MPKRSNEFQRLVLLVKQHVADGASVTESKLLLDRITGTNREVDICIEATVGGHDVVVSLECQDRARPAEVSWVEEMKAKHERLPTNALVLVSRSGFTSEAKAVAHSYGIDTLALEDVSENTIQKLFGDIGSVWAKVFTLRPSKVVIRVPEAGELPAENVRVFPDNRVYMDDGQQIGTVKEVVEFMLSSEHVVLEMGRQGNPSHTAFELRWDEPRDTRGRRLCLQKVEPLILRPIEFVRVLGSCEFNVAEFPLTHGILGGIRVSWGKGTLMGGDAMLVASETESGVRRATTHVTNLRIGRSD